jgi:hypothetical protein
MVNMTLSVPAELHKLMKKHNDVRWAEVARKALWTRAKDIELLDKITGKSTMTLDDVMELDKVIKASAWKKMSHNLK